MKLSEIESAARNLADYLARSGEKADMAVVYGQIKLIGDRAAAVQEARVIELVTKG